jgi:hypothetical protein
MSGQRVERRLAAILAVDVAGYSRLMGQDEEGTLAALRALQREIGDAKSPSTAAGRRFVPVFRDPKLTQEDGNGAGAC